GFRRRERLKPTGPHQQTKAPFWLLFGKTKSNWTAYRKVKENGRLLSGTYLLTKSPNQKKQKPRFPAFAWNDKG
ncbi:hypothetical protein, partial [Vibrio ponticus]|uniref:hypothetical protein n=1 Tax=Vibrio ponticus TaxID=265668 RepID=UPI001C0DEF5C